MRHGRAATAAPAAFADRLVAHVPATRGACRPACRYDIGGAGQYSGRPQSGALGVLLADLVVGLGIERRDPGLRTGSVLDVACARRCRPRRGCRSSPDPSASAAQEVVEDRARRRILARRHLRRPRRRIVHAEAHAHGGRRLDEIRRPGAPRPRGSLAASRSGVTSSRIQYPRPCVPATRSAHRQVAIVLHLQIAHRRSPACRAAATASCRRRRTTPTPACRSRHRAVPSAADPRGSSSTPQPGRDAGVDLRPRLAAVVRAPEVRVEVVDAHRVRRRVRGERVEVARLDVEDARPRLDRRRRDVRPLARRRSSSPGCCRRRCRPRGR